MVNIWRMVDGCIIIQSIYSKWIYQIFYFIAICARKQHLYASY